MRKEKKTNMAGVKVSIHRGFDQNCSEFSRYIQIHIVYELFLEIEQFVFLTSLEVGTTIIPYDSGVLGCRNIVATVNLGCVLNLKTIAMHARNAEYNPKRFAAVIMRIR